MVAKRRNDLALSTKLCNPTPIDVEIKWHKGIIIEIKSDSNVDLDVEQMDDFRPGKPGSEEVIGMMTYHGIFLYDPDLDYDSQALQSLKSCYNAKNAQLRESLSSLRRQRAAEGVTEDAESFEEIKAQMGLNGLETKVGDLKRRVKYYEGIVSEKGDQKSRTGQLDPEKTLFLSDGAPREFPSKAAKNLFKLEYPDQVVGDPAEEVADVTEG